MPTGVSGMTEHTQHCDHEEFCRFFFHDSKIAVHDGTPCMRNHDGCAKCSYDSRTSTTPAPAACEDNGCTDSEACDEICEHQRIYSPAWVLKHDAAVRKEERDKTDIQLKILRENIKKKEFKPYMNHSKKTVWFEDINEIIKSLRDELSCDSQDGG